MNIKLLCENLKFDTDLTDIILKYDKELNYNEIQDKINLLYNRNTWDNGLKQLNDYIKEDEKGLKMLTICLHCLIKTYDMYKNLGISEKIFWDTMKFLTRFINEHKNLHDEFSFTWAWWFVREISMSEFRIGDFEFEFMNDNKTISLHIPSDADLKNGQIDVIFDFAKKYYPEYTNADIICKSWLVVPALKELLPKTSNIIKFQDKFTVNKVDTESLAFMDWVYSSRNIPIKDLPENTTLQRNMKKYLLSGKKIGWGYAVYNKEI